MAVNVTWLGHSTFKIETPEGKIILIDPWLEHNPLCPDGEKDPGRVDVLLCTHGHFDHIGDALPVIIKHQPVVVGIYELATWLGKKGAKNVSPMNKGGSQSVADVNITMVHAIHSCGIQEDDGSIIYGGEACGYVLEFSDGLVIYHSGDTAVFGDMELIADLYAPDVAMLPVGGHFTMGPMEANYACEMLRPRIVIPMHFGTFPILKGRGQDLEGAAEELGFDLWNLIPGEPAEINVEDLEEEEVED